MTNQDGKAPRARRPHAGGEAARRERAPSPAVEDESAGLEPQAEVELRLADLVGDANGEVVFFNDSAFRTVGVSTDAAVVAEGRSGRHVTAGGTDVLGFNYVSFDNGLTLYYDSDIDLVVRRSPGGAQV